MLYYVAARKRDLRVSESFYVVHSFDPEKGFASTGATVFSEKDLISFIAAGNKVQNITVASGKLAPVSGALSRFDNNWGIVVSRLVEAGTDNTIGYRVLPRDGRETMRLRLKDVTTLGNQCKEGTVPFQNAIFVKDDYSTGVRAHIKSFPDCPFPVEEMHTARNKHAIQNNMPVTSNRPDKSLRELDAEMHSLYTKEQLHQLRLGQKSGVNISLYANPKISWEKMEIMRITMEKGFDVSVVAHPEYVVPCNVDSLRYILAMLVSGRDVSQLLNPKYTLAQVCELHSGLINFLDISQYADPSISAESMSKIRENLMKEFWLDPKNYAELFDT